MSDLVDVLIFKPSIQGGISKCTIEQAKELARRGHSVCILNSRRESLALETEIEVKSMLFSVPDTIRSHSIRRIFLSFSILINHLILIFLILIRRPKLVLFDGYSELLAPIWALPHCLVGRGLNLCYAVTVHDPQRISQKGPEWLHELSVWAAYKPFSVVLVHGLDKARQWMPDNILLRDIPHGLFDSSGKDKESFSEELDNELLPLRERLKLSADTPIALAFGYVADRKNLGIAISAVAEIPGLNLIIAGRQASSSDRPVDYYRQLANQIDVGNRVHFYEEYVPDHEVHFFFESANLILLTYSGEFVSQSGVLHMSGDWSTPVVAASGPGPLIETVAKYNLGISVAPDSVESLVSGIEFILSGKQGELGWERFRQNASWKDNIEILLEAVAEHEKING